MLLYESSIFDIKSDSDNCTYVIYHYKSNCHNKFLMHFMMRDVGAYYAFTCFVASLNRRISVA